LECRRLLLEAKCAIDRWAKHVENLEPTVMIEDARLQMEAAGQAYLDHTKVHNSQARKATGYTN